MHSQLREQAMKLRTEKNLSYSEIKRRLGTPKSTLSYWLKGFPLPEERILELRHQGWKKGEASRERYRNTMRKKQELKSQAVYKKQRQRMTRLSKDAFFVAGLMLYLGEGDKRKYAQINLTNTEPRIIKFFIKWVAEFLDITKGELKVGLHLYENMNIDKERLFWQKELGLKASQFYKPSVRKLQKDSFSYKESYRHGTCKIYSFGVEKKRELMMAIQAFLDEYEKRTKGV